MALTRFSGPVKSTNGFRVGASTVDLTLVMKGTVSVDPASLLAATTNDTSVTITGAALGDVIVMNPPDALESGLVFGGARVTAANTVKVRVGNVTAGAIDAAAASWTYAIYRYAAN